MEIEGIIPIKDKENNLIAIVYNDIKNRICRIFLTKECNMEDMKTLLTNITSKTEIEI